MNKAVELVGDTLSLVFFIQAVASLTYLNVLPENFKSFASEFRFMNLHFSTNSKTASDIMDFLNVDTNCDTTIVFLMNLLAVACVIGCILKFRVYIYLRSHCHCLPDCITRYPILKHPTLEIVGFLLCFFGLSLSSVVSIAEECTEPVLRGIAVFVLVVLVFGLLLARNLIARACRGGIEPPSPLAEFSSKV